MNIFLLLSFKGTGENPQATWKTSHPESDQTDEISKPQPLCQQVSIRGEGGGWLERGLPCSPGSLCPQGLAPPCPAHRHIFSNPNTYFPNVKKMIKLLIITSRVHNINEPDRHIPNKYIRNTKTRTNINSFSKALTN